MADTYTRLTLLDIAKRNGNDAVVGMIEETMTATPEIAVIPARTITGRRYKTKVVTELPVVSFRNANEGISATKGKVENRLVETFIMSPRWEADLAVLEEHEDGPEAAIAEEGVMHVSAAMITLAKQIWYGAANDAKGYPGVVNSILSTHEVDAGGPDTKSSVFALKLGPQACQMVWGLNGALRLSDPRRETLRDADDKPFEGISQTFEGAYPGFAVHNVKAIGRIKNLSDDSNTLTDALMSNLLEKFPEAYRPDVFFMTRRSVSQLRKSRTATTDSGKEAQIPTDFDGIPIRVSEAILNNETV